MKVTTILIGAGVAGCLGFFLLPKRSSPATADVRPSQPSAVSVATPAAPSATPAAEEIFPATPFIPKYHPPAISKEDLELGNVLRAEILAAMATSDFNNQELIFSLLAEWMQHDPAGAGRFAKSLPPGRWRETTIRRVAQDWAAQDLASAERWASRLADGSERDSTVTDVCFQVAQTDARQAIEIALRHGLEAASGAVLENLTQQWAGQDLPAATSWIMEQAPGELRDQMLGRLAYVQSQTQPVAAANLVVEQIPRGPIQDEAVMTVLHQWGMSDLPSATAWVNQFSPGALRDRAEAELQGLAQYSR